MNTAQQTLPRSLTSEFIARLGARVRSSTGETTSVEEVFTGGELAALPTSSVADVQSAFDVAREAQRAWAARSVAERVAVFKRFHALLLDNAELLADVLQAEGGKARRTAFEEVCDPALVTSYYIGAAAKLLKPTRRKGSVPIAVGAREYRLPKGIVGLIAPWNFPLAMSISDLIPALIAGNGAVIKPARETPLTTLLGVDLLYQAGLPAELVQVVIGSGSVVGSEVIDHADYVAFTGSTATGQEIARRSGGQLTSCSLELGGKNPMIVLDDADVDAAAKAAAASAFVNAGQLCMHIERVYVPRAQLAEFTDRLVREAKAVELSASYEFGFGMGSLISQAQLDSVRAQVEQARASGATVLAGGKHRPDVGPYFYEPTVLTDVDSTMDICANETFGPVVSVYGYRDEAEALRCANDTVFGLNASVFGKDVARARRVAEQVKAGTVNINDAHGSAYASIDAPMGGLGQSGVGSRHGAQGILKYTDGKTIAVQRFPLATEPKDGNWRKFVDTTVKGLKFMRSTGLR